jgi:micrococcal nuclease
MCEYSATVIEVHDGDTVTLDIDLGLHDHRVGEHIRLAHINAPELHEVNGAKAKARLEELLADRPLVIHTVRDRVEKYGRWLAEIINAAGVDVGQQLLDEGLAVRYEGGRR